MKRVLSLILVLVLALGSVPFAFAADMTSGQELKELGLVKGDSEGNLNEEGMLTRAEMMVMISRLLGVEEEAMNYAIPSTSKDVEGHWAAKYIAYAEQVGNWTSGVGENMFGADEKVTTQMAAKFMLTALGYEANWDTAVADAQALGLMEGVSSEATANITRGEVFTTSLNTVNTPKKDSEVTLGVSLGVVKEEVKVVATLEGAVIDAVKSVGNNLVEITFEDDVDAVAAANVANYGVTEKLTTSNVIVINSVVVNDTDRVTLETAALKLGVAYTLTFDGEGTNFSGLAVDKDVPEVDSVKGYDTGMVKVVFADALVDTATAEDIANYVVNKEGTVVKAALQSDRKTVKLTVEGFTTKTAKELTVENVLSVDKVAMKKTTKVFFPKYDEFAPKFDIDESSTARINNVKVTIKVTDENGIDEATAEDIANYSIDGLSVTKAEAKKSDDDKDYFDRIVLTTSEQTNGKSYTLKINNLVDGSNAKNAMTKEASESFRGAAADKTKPSVQSPVAKTNTEIHVPFSEKNKLDPTTALNPANYVLGNSDFQILEAKFLDDDEDEKTIVLTTSTQPSKKTNVKLTISGISDEFNNTMEKVTKSFSSAIEDTTKPSIVGIASTGKTVELTVTFENDVEKATAIDPTNYTVNNDIGSPIDAELKGKVVTLTFDELTAGKTYKLTVKNITNLYDVVMDDKTTEFIAAREEADTTLPEIDSYYVTNVTELRVTFDEEVTATVGTSKITMEDDNNVVLTASYVSTLDDDKTLVYKIANASANDGKEFKMTDVTAVKDTAGNLYIYDTEDELSVSLDGVTADIEKPKLLSWAQEDLRTFILYFDKEVAKPAANETIYTFSTEAKADAYTGNVVTTSEKTFDLSRDSDDYTILKMESTSAIDDEFASWVNFEFEVTDLVGNVTEDEAVEISGGLIDETAPNIISVTAIDKNTVEVKYDEVIGYKGSYKIVEDGKTSNIITATNHEDDDDFVTLTVKSMDDSTIYEFSQNSLAKDVAKSPNKASDYDTYTFLGVENDAEKIYFVGADVVNGTEVNLKLSEETTDTITSTEVTITGGTVVLAYGVAFDDDTLTLTTTGNDVFAKGTTYTVTLTVNSIDVDVEFEGLVDVLSIDADNTDENTLTDYDDNDNFVVTIFDKATDSNAAADTVTIDSNGVVTTTGIATGVTFKLMINLGDNVIYTTTDITAK